MQTGYIHMRIGNSLGIVTTDVLAQTQVKAEGRVQPGLFRFWDVSEGRKPTAQGPVQSEQISPCQKRVRILTAGEFQQGLIREMASDADPDVAPFHRM